jgi:hypothetical protein
MRFKNISKMEANNMKGSFTLNKYIPHPNNMHKNPQQLRKWNPSGAGDNVNMQT